MTSFARALRVAAGGVAATLIATTAHARGFTPEDLVGLQRLGDPQVSPDGSRVLYDLRTTDRAADRGRHAIWVVATAGGAPQPQAQSDGSAIYYLKDGQVWRARACTAGCADATATQVTHLPLDVGAYRLSPAHVADWAKPQLIIHGGRDYRIPLEQGLGAFDALQRKGVESRFLYFPDENHWVFKPADSLLWHATVLGWLDAHLKT